MVALFLCLFEAETAKSETLLSPPNHSYCSTLLGYSNTDSKIDYAVTRQKLLTTVSSVLESALAEKQAAERAREFARTQNSTTLQEDPDACTWSFWGPFNYSITALPLVKMLLNIGGLFAGDHQGNFSAGEARQFQKAYADKVRIGMTADKAPAVASRPLPTPNHPMSSWERACSCR